MEIALIYARAANGVIGANGSMPWHLPEDLAHFKQCTLGQPVIMGRKTWDSLPARFRPLPERCNIVITRQLAWQALGAKKAASLAQALDWARQTQAQTAWIVGGAQIYAQALPLAGRVEITEIARDYVGDAYAPLLGDAWQETARSEQVTSNGLRYAFVTLTRPRNTYPHGCQHHTSGESFA